MPPWAEVLIAGAGALACALLWAAAALLHLRRLRLPRRHRTGPVTLILPLTGAAPGLEALFAALAAQTLAPRRLLVAVESEEDPAAARARALAPLLPCPLEVVLAGRSDRRAQKNTNLLAALARLDGREGCVVLLDADIRPQPWWLSALATPVLDGEAALVTGYRWPLLDRAGPVPLLVAWLDRTIALLPKLRRLRVVWGGSLAIAPRALPALDLPRLLDRTLSDDLSIGARAAEAGLRVLTRRALLLPTPTEGSARAVFAFMRRQLQLIRLYRPGWWWGAAVAVHAALASWAWLAALAIAGSAPALALLAAVSACGAVRWRAMAAVGCRIGVADPPGGRAALLALALLPPLPEGFLCALLWASARTRRIRWRHVEYEVRGPDDVRVARRFAHARA
ncbi:glycosyltransferase [Caldovatus aquaticus]|uniref:Glycosyltransferase n=1 Tax=Caldovatus aquaticus TaxID=2865671 RepID=A0ABS7F412_9PROT|nr:glycosyltransferase [Caldovatus aquaticus]MBW8269707.1 glycosyltransferase [Caldovatus aquaticus]